MNWLLRWLRYPAPRGEVKLFSWAEANQLLSLRPPQWKLAPREDANRTVGWVFLERILE